MIFESVEIDKHRLLPPYKLNNQLANPPS